jgi:hypothetical protein
MSERETALGMAEYVLHRFDIDADAARQTLEGLRKVS